jgi:hypothetical protein
MKIRLAGVQNTKENTAMCDDVCDCEEIEPEICPVCQREIQLIFEEFWCGCTEAERMETYDCIAPSTQTPAAS